MTEDNSKPCSAYELIGAQHYRRPIAAHAFVLDRHADRILCSRTGVSYSVALGRLWSGSQPLQRCLECAELTAHAARSSTA